MGCDVGQEVSREGQEEIKLSFCTFFGSEFGTFSCRSSSSSHAPLNSNGIHRPLFASYYFMTSH